MADKPRRRADTFVVPVSERLQVVILCGIPAVILLALYRSADIPLWSLLAGLGALAIAAWMFLARVTARLIVDDRGLRIEYLRGPPQLISMNAIAAVDVEEYTYKGVTYHIPVVHLHDGKSLGLHCLRKSADEVYISITARLG